MYFSLPLQYFNSKVCRMLLTWLAAIKQVVVKTVEDMQGGNVEGLVFLLLQNGKN
jgi:hypothetical protein